MRTKQCSTRKEEISEKNMQERDSKRPKFIYQDEEPNKKKKAILQAQKQEGGEGEEDEEEEEELLIPGLPDHLAQLCLSDLPPSLLYSVCGRWRQLIYAPSFPPFLTLYAVLARTTEISINPSIEFQSYDPYSTTWTHLPPLPLPSSEILLRHPSFPSRDLPVQTLSAGNDLIVVGATATNRLIPALPQPLVFDTTRRRWRLVPPLPTPRRWCAAGYSTTGKSPAVYVASGIGGEHSHAVARSMERWSRTEERWETLSSLPDGRFSRESIDAIGVKGKLLMVNSKSSWARDGIVYNVSDDRWETMPSGMLDGWKGPAAAADDTNSGSIYAIEESKGLLWEYNWKRDRWAKVIRSEKFEGTSQLTAGGGKICAVVGGGAVVVVFDVAKRRMMTVDPPEGRQILAIHLLPRMSVDDGY